MESIFGQDEPEEELRTERERELLQQAMAKANAVARSIYIYTFSLGFRRSLSWIQMRKEISIKKFHIYIYILLVIYNKHEPLLICI